MFGKRNAPMAPATPSYFGATQAKPSAPTFDRPITYDRLLQSIREDAHFYDRNVDPRALMAALEQDPYLLQKEQAGRLNQTMFQLLANWPNNRIETHLGALGAMAGWVCLREACQKYAQGVRLEHCVFDTLNGISFDSLQGRDGRTYYFGNLIDLLLLKHENSIWQMTGNKALSCGAARMPEMDELWDHVKTTFQLQGYGTPRHPFDKAISGRPIELARALWPQLASNFLSVTKERCEVHQVFGVAIQEGIHHRPADVDAGFLAAAVMECAMPMAHIVPDTTAAAFALPVWGTIQ